MPIQQSILDTLSYTQYRNSPEGQALVSKSEEDAVAFLFDLDTLCDEIDKQISPRYIYLAVCCASSLSIELEDQTVHLETGIPDLSEESTLGLLHDIQTAFERNAILGALEAQKSKSMPSMAGTSPLAILDVDLTIYADEETGELNANIREWIQSVASMRHVSTGEPGVFEYLVNLARTLEDIPSRLSDLIVRARETYAYLLFRL